MEYNNLKEKTVSGLIWSFIDLMASQGFQFIILIFLARMLTPEHFGMIGMITIFIAISHSIIDSGLSQALIREKAINKGEYSTIFFFNLFMSGIFYLILYLLAPFISNFFAEQQLTIVIRVLALGLIINSFSIIQRVILIRNINFKIQTIITLISVSLSGAMAIILAYKGFGVWSLVAHTLTLQISQALLLWGYNRWMPMFTFSFAYLRKLIGFGARILISGLIDTIYLNIFSVIIGRLYPAYQLGYYTNANKISDAITKPATHALQRVTYPVLSSIQDDHDSLKSMYQRAVKMAAFIMFPIMTGLIAISDSLIPLLLGVQWQNSVIYFKLICFASMVYPLHVLNLIILQVKGRADVFLKLEIMKKTLLTLLIGVSLFFSYGIVGLLVAQILSSYISLYINGYYSAAEISYPIKNQIKDVLPSFLIAALMGGIVYFSRLILPENYVINVFVQIIIGVACYISFSKIAKIEELKILFNLFIKYISMYQLKSSSRT